MYTGILHLHSTLAVAVIIGLLLTIIFALVNKPVNDTTRKVAKISMILLHTQFLAGLILYFISPRGFAMFSEGGVMGDSLLRLFAVEHPFVGLLAVALVTVGHTKLKRAAAEAASKPILIFYTLGLLLVLSRIPWQTWSLFN